jgi:hypothetical protein
MRYGLLAGGLYAIDEAAAEALAERAAERGAEKALKRQKGSAVSLSEFTNSNWQQVQSSGGFRVFSQELVVEAACDSAEGLFQWDDRTESQQCDRYVADHASMAHCFSTQLPIHVVSPAATCIMPLSSS